MRKLPSSASSGNLQQLVDSASNVLYSSDGPSMILQSPRGSNNAIVPNNNVNSNVAMSSTLDVNTNMQPNTNMATSVATTCDDRSNKKSLAYLHTKFLELRRDDFGKTFERRTCNYCGAGFSFKGGTTSAALRHVKTMHPERVVYNEVTTSKDEHPVGYQAPVNNTQSLDTGNSIQVMEPEQIVSRSTSANEVIQRKHNDVDTVAATVDINSRNALQRENSAVSLVASIAAGSSLKRKRHDGENSGDTHNEMGSTVSKTIHSSSSKFTASQEAIRHFLRHYANELPHPAMRLRFAKHLTHNVPEAEMYNVLDPATQMEYIREFAQPPTN